jgi:putative transposase
MALERKRIRLERERYRGRRLFFLTFCTAHRDPIFISPQPAEWLVRRLHELAVRYSFQLHAWCLMPDHLHVLIAGALDTSDMIFFAARFKQITAFEGKRLFAKTLWQTHSYDHVVRGDEAGERIAAYIWSNPVRKGLCSDARDYPHSGSDTLEWKRTIFSAPDWIPPWKVNVLGRKPSQRRTLVRHRWRGSQRWRSEDRRYAKAASCRRGA